MKNEKKKLLVFHPALAPYRIDFWNGLNESYDLKIFFLFKNPLEQKFDQAQLKNKLQCECNYLNSGFRIGRRVFRWGFLPIIRKFKPDIVYTYEYSQTTLWLYLIKKIFRYKFQIFSICDDSLEIAANCRGLRKIMRDILVERIDGLVVISDVVATWYKNNYRLKNECICFPIIAKETEFRAQLEAAVSQSNRLLDEFNLSEKKCILYVGRLVNVKGIDRLIMAFAGICRYHPGAVLILVGNGKQLKSLKKVAAKAGVKEKVYFVGRCDGIDLLAWYNIGQVFVLASHHEPFGAVVNEALLAGTNVLCSEKAGAAGLIVPGINGEIFDPYNIDLLRGLLNKELINLSPVKSINCIRPSKMQITFEQCFNIFKTKWMIITCVDTLIETDLLLLF